MKQVLLRGGKAVVDEVPAPGPKPGQVLVRVAWSCVSSGTELATAATTTVSGVLERLRRDPVTVQKALNVFRDRGLRTFSAMARERLTFGTSPGYSCSGTILETGSGVVGFVPGDRVACAGEQYAKHAEIVAVPVNLTVAVPPDVDLANASTVTLGAIAMQGVRRAQVTLGERIGVIGLGFLGQLTVQILKAAGCSVFGSDRDPARMIQAKSLGLDAASGGDVDAIAAAHHFSDGYGLDAVILTASTSSNEPLYLAMQMVRRKGRVVVVGDVGLAARRDAMYAKELDLLISTSYGPGRYDSTYEEEGLDYPYAYVRWTENRNMQAYLDLIAAGRLQLAPLIVRRLPVIEATEAYRVLKEENPRPYTILLEYPTSAEAPTERKLSVRNGVPPKSGKLRLAIVGAGSFARGVHLPNLRRLGDCFQIDTIITSHGPTALATAKQVGARAAATDYQEALADPQVDAVLVATRHHLHAEMVKQALRARKHVFVEKPLALTEEEIQSLEGIIEEIHNSGSECPVVFVGFNRRYSPFAVRLRELVATRSTPLNLSYRMNAGYLPPEHWVHGVEGGGRIVGEACHIFDLFRFFAGEPAVESWATGLHASQRDVQATDNFTATVRYADGSLCTLLYTAQGAKDLPKEALEMHVEGRSFILDDYRSLCAFGTKVKLHTRRQEKGHLEELNAFRDAIRGLLDRRTLWEEAVEVSRVALEVDRQVRGSQTFRD